MVLENCFLLLQSSTINFLCQRRRGETRDIHERRKISTRKKKVYKAWKKGGIWEEGKPLDRREGERESWQHAVPSLDEQQYWFCWSIPVQSLVPDQLRQLEGDAQIFITFHL